MDLSEILEKKYEFMPIKAFKERFELTYTIEAIAYHIKHGKIDSYKPSRDRYIVITDKTLKFYDLEL